MKARLFLLAVFLVVVGYTVLDRPQPKSVISTEIGCALVVTRESTVCE